MPPEAACGQAQLVIEDYDIMSNCSKLSFKLLAVSCLNTANIYFTGNKVSLMIRKITVINSGKFTMLGGTSYK